MRFQLPKCLFLLLFLFATGSWAQATEKRVLFIVETSKETKSLAEAERKLVGALVETGLGGLLEANDTFGVWTFDENLHVGKFPMQRWLPEGRGQLAARVQEFLEAQSHGKSSNIETVWRPLQSVVRNSPALMVVLVTSGKQPISGTPFDAEINQHLKRVYRDYQKKKTPAVIMLSATSAEVLRYSVNPAIGDVRVPVLDLPPPPPVKLVQPAPVPKTNAAPPQPKVAAPTPAPKSNTAFVITKDGGKNISIIEADRISTDNFQGTPDTTIEEIKGPMILKHAEEVVTHTIKIEPDSTNVTIKVQSPATPTEAEAKPIAPVVKPAPTPVLAAPAEPVNPKPAVAEVAPQPKAVSPKPSKPIQPDKQVTEIIAPKAAPIEVAPQAAQKKEPIKAEPEPTTVLSNPEPAAAPIEMIQPKIAPDAVETGLTPPVVSIPSEAEVTAAPKVDSQPLVAQTSAAPTRPFPFLLAAIGLIIVAIILAFLVGRQTSKRPQQSLVSEWAERDRTKK